MPRKSYGELRGEVEFCEIEAIKTILSMLSDDNKVLHRPRTRDVTILRIRNSFDPLVIRGIRGYDCAGFYEGVPCIPRE